MTEVPSITSQPRRTLTLLIAALALAFLLGGSLISTGTADAKKKQRVVSISPFATEVLAKVGVRPIAIGALPIERDRNRIPAKFKGVRVLPLSHPNGPNLEQLAKIRPTLIFSSTRWRKGTPAMNRLGIRVVYVDPLNLAQTYRGAKQVGRWVNRKKQSARLVRTMRKQVKSATRGIRKHPKVMGILGVGRNPQTFLDNSWGGQMIRLAGGTLLTGNVKNIGGFAPISDEVVVVQNPQVIIAVPHGSVTDFEEATNYILDNPAWQTVDAVKNRKVFLSTDNRLLQAGTDVGYTIRWVRRTLNQAGS